MKGTEEVCLLDTVEQNSVLLVLLLLYVCVYVHPCACVCAHARVCLSPLASLSGLKLSFLEIVARVLSDSAMQLWCFE